MLLQRLAQLARALLLSLKQPHVLDRDNCLVSEGFSETYLLVGERLHDTALEEQNANGHAFALQGDAE